MVMVGNHCHAFIKTVFVLSEHGVALDDIYQDITLRELRKDSDLQKVSLLLVLVAMPRQSPQKENYLNTWVGI